jgi:PAS domain S-box-containing protein
VDVDIDDMVRANQQLRTSESELQLILNTVPAQIWLLGTDGSIYFLNKSCSDWLGIEQVVTSGNRRHLVESYFHRDDAAIVQTALHKAFVTLKPLHLQARLRRRDGEYRWVDLRAAAMRDELGAVVRWYGISFEIEEEVRAVEALQRSEQHLQRVIDTVPIVLMRANSEGELVYANARFEDEFGYGLEQLGSIGKDRRGKTLQMLVHPDDRPEVEQAMQQSFRTGKPFRRRYRKIQGGGNYRWIEARIEPLLDVNGKIIEWYGVNLDVDDEVRAQENLHLAQEKLARTAQAASVAQLSASIAQEVHRPLASIAENARACEQWLSSGAPNLIQARQIAAEMIKNAESASKSVNRIRSLFKSSARSNTSALVDEPAKEALRSIRK